MRIAGIDPGMATTGYAVVDHIDDRMHLLEAGVIQTIPRDSLQTRLKILHEGIMDLLTDWKPEVMAIEKLFSDYQHPTTAILMGHARGVICLAAGLKSIQMADIPVTRVKKAIVSNGHASKQQVAEAVSRILELKKTPKPADVTDAMALAVTYAYTRRFDPAEALR